MSGVVLDNNLMISGFRYQIINLEEMGTGLANRNTTIRNNILVRVESRATIYRRAGDSTGENFQNNLEILDTNLNDRDSDFHDSRPPYPTTSPATAPTPRTATSSTRASTSTTPPRTWTATPGSPARPSTSDRSKSDSCLRSTAPARTGTRM